MNELTDHAPKAYLLPRAQKAEEQVPQGNQTELSHLHAVVRGHHGQGGAEEPPDAGHLDLTEMTLFTGHEVTVESKSH